MKYKEEIKKLKEKITRYKRLSYKDDLTWLWNKRKLNQDIKRYQSLKKRFGIKFLLMMIDLDNFKEINDTKGHKAGDLLLKRVAEVLKKNIRNYENAYHISGDEFVLIISHYKNYQTIKNRIKNSLSKIKVNASIGICDIDKKYCLEVADKEMYKEKRRKK